MSWTVETLDKRVEKELNALPADIRADMYQVVKLLEEYGPDHLNSRHVRFLGGALWEIRAKAQTGIGRSIYVKAKGRRLVVVHAFVKKSQKTPKAALDLARKRAKEIDHG